MSSHPAHRNMSCYTKHVRQEHQAGCMLACIAMVTGKTYKEIQKIAEVFLDLPDSHDWDTRGIGNTEMMEILMSQGFEGDFYPCDVPEKYKADSVAIVAVPSITRMRVLHVVVVERVDYELFVFDPQEGNGCLVYDAFTIRSWADEFILHKRRL